MLWKHVLVKGFWEAALRRRYWSYYLKNEWS